MSVCPSVTSPTCTKTAKLRITLTTPYRSPETPVFRCQKSRRNSNDITPNRGRRKQQKSQKMVLNRSRLPKCHNETCFRANVFSVRCVRSIGLLLLLVVVLVSVCTWVKDGERGRPETEELHSVRAVSL